MLRRVVRGVVMGPVGAMFAVAGERTGREAFRLGREYECNLRLGYEAYQWRYL